ncbi:p24 complex component [Podila humilis]|nr:p24 complex component [Podila humilis]
MFMAAMATELARVQESFNALQKEFIKIIHSDITAPEGEKQVAEADNAEISDFWNCLPRCDITDVSTGNISKDQHSGVSLTELEQSILETIEADTDNVDTGYDPVADADTSSFMLDGEVESSFSSYMPKNVKVSSGSKSANVNSSFAANARPRAATAAVEGYSNASSLNNGGTSASTLEQSPNNDRKLLKFGSAESLRLKRNTISSSARPVYQHNNVSKRHSSISPLSPKSRQIVSSSKVPAGSASFSNSSSPSTSPREPSKPMGAFSSRTARQHQQQKEYSLSVRNTMSQLAGLSTGGSGSTSTSRRPQPMETVSLVQNSTSSPGSSDSAKRTRRSESGVMPTTHPSPAAKEHLKQQERLQEQERSALKGRALALSPHSIQTTRTPGDHDKQSSYSQLQIAPSTIQNQSKNGTSVRNLKDERRYASDTAESMKGSQRTASAQERRKQPYQREGASISGQNGGGGVDANAFTLLYKEIRDSMDSTSFGLFARVVTAFNEGEKSTDETLQEVSRIVKDRALNQRFKNLIEQAIAEKENQMEKAGNETMEGDLTLEIDHSLLMDPVEEEEEEELLLGEGVAIFTVAVLATLQAVAAFNVVVPAQERRCFYENLDVKDNLHISYQVGEGGHLDLTDPNDIMVEDASRSASATYNHVAKIKGKHQYCFSNAFSTITEKTVGFNVMVIKPYVEDATHKVDPLENEIRELSYQIEDIKNEQEYTLARERTHRNTAESTNSRVVWWSLFQSGILFLVCVFQITYLKRFFEVKRVV